MKRRMVIAAVLFAGACGDVAPPVGKSTAAQTQSPDMKLVGSTPMKWAAVVDRLSPGNVLRLLWKRKDPQAKLSPEETKLLAAYDADMDAAFVIARRIKRSPKPLPEDIATLQALHAKHAAAKNELYQAIVASPELPPAVRTAFDQGLRLAAPDQRMPLPEGVTPGEGP